MNLNKFAFVILNYKNVEDTISLLKDIKNQDWFEQVKIYVVDNNSQDRSVEKLKEIQKDIKFQLIISNENLGFAKGNNLGIKKALKDGYKFVICSNADISLKKQDDFLKKIISIYNNDRNIGIIAPNIYNLDGVYQNPFREKRFNKREILKMKFFYLTNFYKLYYFIRIYILYDLITKLAKKRKLNNIKQNRLKKSQYIYAPHGSFLIFTPSYFKYYNGFYENTFLYCEEFILAERLIKKDLKCFFENSLNVLHKESKSTDKVVKNYKEKVKFTLKHTFESCKYFAKILELN